MPYSKDGILNLGCGNRILSNAINHNLWKHRPEVDIVWNLNELPWPWEDESFGHISAVAVLEHLDIDLLTAVNECWRILKPGGQVEIKLPYWNHDKSYGDPSHRYVAGMEIFDCFDPTTDRGARYSFYTDRKWEIVRVALNEERSSIWGWMRKIPHAQSRE
jgi:predicted SAM-dependent methyltransferase